MPSLDRLPPLIVLLGPTGVGKTEISIFLAERFQGEIVSADSRLFYIGMDIGTAKPGPEELAKVPHHLIDIVLPDQPMSLVAFHQAAKVAIDDIHRRGKLPFLVGGTGQYIRAVIEDWGAPPQEPDLVLRQVIERWGTAIGAVELHHKLSILDPQAAARIEPRNLRRSVRALEVIFQSGYRFSSQQRKGDPPYRTLLIGLIRPRDELYRRIDERIERMVANGFLKEAQALLERGYSADLPALSAIGYREMVQVVKGQLSLDEAVARVKQATRQFVRRQANWFKTNDPSIRWFDLSRSGVDEIAQYLQSSI